MTTVSAISPTSLHRLWDQGQQHLAAGRYVAARTDLESAEAIAWRNRDAASLARLYLPLLESRRLIRYSAAEGTLLIDHPSHTTNHLPTDFLQQSAGTILLNCGSMAHHANVHAACKLAGSVRFAARRTGRFLEALLLLHHGPETRLASPADPTFAAGLPVQWTQDPHAAIGDSTTPNLPIPLPPPGHYSAAEKKINPLHALTRESLIIAWEALALRWQHRHPPPKARNSKIHLHSNAWQEIAWLRLALHIDPACEPISMRIISLAEAIERATF